MVMRQVKAVEGRQAGLFVQYDPCLLQAGFLRRFYQYLEERIMKRNNLRLLFLVIGFSLFMAVWTKFSAERPPFYQEDLDVHNQLCRGRPHRY